MTVPLPAASQPSNTTTVGISASLSWYWSWRSRSCRPGNTFWYLDLDNSRPRSTVSSMWLPRSIAPRRRARQATFDGAIMLVPREGGDGLLRRGLAVRDHAGRRAEHLRPQLVRRTATAGGSGRHA